MRRGPGSRIGRASWILDRRSFIAFALAVVGATATQAQSGGGPPRADSTISALTPLLGRWMPPQDVIERIGPLVVQDYELTVGGYAIRLREGYQADARDDAELEGLIYWNPARERIQLVAVAGRASGQGRYFEGEYRLLEDGAIERTYTVHYRSGPDTPAEELGGRTRRFREVYRFQTADSLQMTLDWWQGGRWRPFGLGTFILRRSVEPATAPSDR